MDPVLTTPLDLLTSPDDHSPPTHERPAGVRNLPQRSLKAAPRSIGGGRLGGWLASVLNRHGPRINRSFEHRPITRFIRVAHAARRGPAQSSVRSGVVPSFRPVVRPGPDSGLEWRVKGRMDERLP